MKKINFCFKFKYFRANIEILGALLKNACYSKNYDYVIAILITTINEEVKPSEKFVQILSDFKKSRYNKLQKNPDEQEQIEFNHFYKTYLRWKQEMGFSGPFKDFVKTLREHPWKQFQEPQEEGIEHSKNSYIRHLWKKRHVIQKVTPYGLGVDNRNENDKNEK